MEAYNEYLKSIEIEVDSEIYKRIQKHYEFYNGFLEIEISDIFISEIIDQEGNRIYQSLWFFNEESISEVTSFITKDDYDQDRKEWINSWTLTKSNFDDLENPNDQSRAVMKIYMANSSREGLFQASKGNCKKLMEIFKEQIVKHYNNEDS